ncbi:MAG: universal stress protein [Thermodesulfobacteriota bacterium]
MDINYNLIELFDLDENYTYSQLEQSYNDLVQVWHPDKYSHNKRLKLKAEEKLKEINLAYAKLKQKLAKSDKKAQIKDGKEKKPLNKDSRKQRPKKNKAAHRVNIRGIFHPTDFSHSSEVAFAHALKFSLIAKTKLNIMHVSPKHTEVDWVNFPRIRKTLAYWNTSTVLNSEDSPHKIGLHVQKVIGSHEDPVASTLNFLESNPTDLIVLSTNQRKGKDRWLSKSISEPIARRSGEMTLFIPKGVKGFISLEDGSIKLERILIPIDENPNPQIAVDTAYFIARFLGCTTCHFILVHVSDNHKFPNVRIPQHDNWSWEKIHYSGDTVKEILKIGDLYSVDLIVMTTHGHNGFLDALRGSTTERVLRKSGCPLLAVPSYKVIF